MFIDPKICECTLIKKVFFWARLFSSFYGYLSIFVYFAQKTAEKSFFTRWWIYLAIIFKLSFVIFCLLENGNIYMRSCVEQHVKLKYGKSNDFWLCGLFGMVGIKSFWLFFTFNSGFCVTVVFIYFLLLLNGKTSKLRIYGESVTLNCLLNWNKNIKKPGKLW